MSKPSKQALSIFTLLFRHSPKMLVFAAVLGAFAGVLYSFIIPFVLKELERQSGVSTISESKFLLPGIGPGIFFLVCGFILAAKTSSIILVNNIAKSATGELRLSIAEKISAMTTDGIEATGFSRLLNVLIDDVNMVAAAAVTIPMLMVSGVTVVGMLAYLATLNLAVFAVIVVAIIAGVTMFQVPVSMAGGLYMRARELRDVIQEGVRGLISGVYELKLDPLKSRQYRHEELTLPQRESVRLEKIGDAVLHLAGNSSDLLAFFIIGLLVYFLPRYVHVPPSQSYGVVMAMLYIAGPIAAILGGLRQLQLGRVAVARIAGLEGHVEEIAKENSNTKFGSWTRFGVRAVSYRYPQSALGDEDGFALAPVSLEFQRGQINFIVGGNGSGKSTLSKLISLHYKPLAGHAYFDDVNVDAFNLVNARSHISVIFSNYYLFRKFYRPLNQADQVKIQNLLAALGLTGKTELIDGQFTTTRLSDGQRRRLALLVALVEDRDIYIFDEWAADQDPAFKQLFYRDILQDMKRNNKLVIVITHDDRYFDCADRLILMESGKVSEIRDQARDLDTASNDADCLPVSA